MRVSKGVPRISAKQLLSRRFYLALYILNLLCRHSDEAYSVDLSWAVNFPVQKPHRHLKVKTWLLKAIKHILYHYSI